VALLRRGREDDLAEACAEFASALKFDLDNNMDARSNFKLCADRLLANTSTVPHQANGNTSSIKGDQQ
jgi:hypothetical protein